MGEGPAENSSFRTLVASFEQPAIQVGMFPTALKIHISQCTAEILLQAGSFELEERGEIEIKVSKDLCCRRSHFSEVSVIFPTVLGKRVPQDLLAAEQAGVQSSRGSSWRSTNRWSKTTTRGTSGLLRQNTLCLILFKATST